MPPTGFMTGAAVFRERGMPKDREQVYPPHSVNAVEYDLLSGFYFEFHGRLAFNPVVAVECQYFRNTSLPALF
jgi:hypothetical protein